MMIHEITPMATKNKDRKRVGRGRGSGTGKTAGRGRKGAGARSGFSRRISFEGGQMPYFRRMPKLGFTNAPFRELFWTVNIREIIEHDSFKSGGEVNLETLKAAGLVRDDSRTLKIRGAMPEGQDALKVKLSVTANRVTDPARALITDAGGSVTETGTRRDRVRGVDRNADDRSPSNQTKKARRRQIQQDKYEAAAKGEVYKRG